YHHAARGGLFFFFQAEDGIRDRNVTGVQTCALPIYLFSFSQQILFDIFDRTALHTYKVMVEMVGALFPEVIAADPVAEVNFIERSEERRVGKECSCGREREQ